MKTLLLPCTALALLTTQAKTQSLLDPRTQTQFVNALPIPQVIDARNGGTYSFSITQFNQQLGLRNPATGAPMATTVWGYNGTYPGPTIVARQNVPIDVFWHNNLVDGQDHPLPHLLPVDRTVSWAMSGMMHDGGGVPIVTHLHGGHTESASDGLPMAWYTPHFAMKGEDFVKGDNTPYHYDNAQQAATIWYHDHAMGITRLNVYAGLAGFYLLTDNTETALQAQNKLPASPYDIGLAIQDRMFTSDGQLFYPAAPEMPGDPSPSVLPEFFGNYILVNGATWPVLEVEPRPYRFRILNGSDSRFYNLFLSNGQSFTQIGTDGGLLPVPVPMTQMLIGTGERKEVIIDFSNAAGQTIILRNNAKTPYPKGRPADPLTTGRIMAFRVTRPLDTRYPKAVLPSTLRTPIAPLQTTLPARKLVLFEATDDYGRLKPMLGTVSQGVLGFDEPATENPALNSTEIWEIYNETGDAHPIHLHLVQMQLLSRQPFLADVDPENGKPTNIRLLSSPRGPGADEAGWKDTYVMNPGEVTRVIARFDRAGKYVWHCHILSHEDHEMMRPLVVGNSGTERTKGAITESDLERKLQFRATPNPFNNELRIELTLAAASKVSLRLYDAQGRMLRDVFDGNKDAGSHVFRIDGSAMTNGAYFLETVVNSERLLRKLVLQH